MITLHQNGKTLDLKWNNDEQSQFHAIWLRDHCRCEECGEAAIGRRNLRLSNLDLDVTITHATLQSADEANTIRIEWSDGHCGEFNLNWLQSNAYDESSRKNRVYQPVTWNDGFKQQPVSLYYDEVIDDESTFLQMLNTVKKYGLCFVKGSPPQSGTVELLAKKIGPPQESNFGRIQDLIADKTRRSIANDVDALKPHTDEPYRASPPGLLLFHCIETDQNGIGASIFQDGFEAASTLRNEDPQGFEALTKHNQGFRRHFEGEVDLITEFPTISIDEFGNICGIRINDRVAAPVCIDPEDVENYYRGMKRILELMEDDSRVIEKVLQPGDIAIFDNHRILHGRTRLQFKGRRWLQWAQIERGDFYSTLRILSDKLGIERDALPLLRGAYG